MNVIGGEYISNIKFDKSYDEKFYVFFARIGVIKDGFIIRYN